MKDLTPLPKKDFVSRMAVIAPGITKLAAVLALLVAQLYGSALAGSIEFLTGTLTRVHQANGCAVIAALVALPKTRATALKAGIPKDWSTSLPCALTANQQVQSASISGVAHWLSVQTAEDRRAYFDRLDSWLSVYQKLGAVGRLAYSEGLASAIALTDCTRQAFPRADELIAKLGHHSGETLAFAEFPGLQYTATMLISQLPPRSKLQCLSRLLATASANPSIRE